MNYKYINDYDASKDLNYIKEIELISFNFNDYILKEEQLLMIILPKIGKVKIYIFGIVVFVYTKINIFIMDHINLF